MNPERHRIFQEICRKEGWKCTSQRLAVYDFLCGNGTHPDVDSVWAAVQRTLPSITRESVYRILNELADKQIIRRMDQIESARYDCRTAPHGHFICEKCGAIFDFDLPATAGPVPEKLPGRIRHWDLRAVGLCGECMRREAEK